MICAREGWPSRECKPVWCTPIRAAQNHDKIQNSEFWYQLVYNSLTTDNINGPSGLQRAEQTSGRLLEREQCMYVMTALFPAICGPWNNGNYCHLQIVNFASDLWAFCSRVYTAHCLLHCSWRLSPEDDTSNKDDESQMLNNAAWLFNALSRHP